MSDEIDKATNSVPMNDQPTPAKRNLDHVQKDSTAATNGGPSPIELDSTPAKNSTGSNWVKFENDEGESDKVSSVNDILNCFPHWS